MQRTRPTHCIQLVLLEATHYHTGSRLPRFLPAVSVVSMFHGGWSSFMALDNEAKLTLPVRRPGSSCRLKVESQVVAVMYVSPYSPIHLGMYLPTK
jgi:hypothetical protein